MPPRARPVSSLALALGLAFACSALLTACVPMSGTIPERKLPDSDSCGSLEAGAASVDLTPPPGYPLGGFSIESRMSRGAWTPLKARAIYLRDARCQPAVLVSTDLMILPIGLRDRVAELLSEDDTTRVIGRENLLLAATENHLSPGNYFSSKLYNSFSTPVAGFDPDLFEFLSERIRDAIAAAMASPQKAQLRTGHGTLKDFFRNRALPAFLRNREAKDFLQNAQSTGADVCPALPYAAHPLASPERFHELSCLAVRPRMDVLELWNAAGSSRIAVAGFLATHTTVLPAPVEVFAADLLGLTALRMERGELPAPCAADGGFPVVALFNGASGDVSTQWTTRDRGDVLALSDRIAETLCDALPGSVDPMPSIHFQHQLVHPLTERSFDDPFDGQKYLQRTPRTAEGGVAELGGASDGRTSLYDLAHREEVTSYRRTEHGSKLPPFTIDAGRVRFSIGSKAFEETPPPDRAPLASLRLGKTVLVSVPGEMTTMMGARTRRLVAAKAGVDEDQVVLVGFGNGHVSYFPTTEEYDAQFYEGASDYYGPGTGSYLATVLARLAGKAQTASVHLPARDYDYKVGEIQAFRPRDAGHPAYHVDDGVNRIVDALAMDRESIAITPVNPIVAGADELRIPRRENPTFCFLDALPRLRNWGDDPDDDAAGVCRRNLPAVAVHLKDQKPVAKVDGRVQNSSGTEIVTILSAAGEDRAEWCAIWLAPRELDEDGLPTNLDTEYEFEVLGVSAKNAGEALRSPPFTIRKGFVQDDPDSLQCATPSHDEQMTGGHFTQRAQCTPLERDVCHGFWKWLGWCDLGTSYCEAP